MKRLVLIVLFILLIALGMSFATLNAHPVRLNYYAGVTEAPLALITVLAVAAGALVGIFASLVIILSQRRENSRLRRRIALCEQEIRNLRHIPITDKH